jgi:ArsR family transcriptional regulator, virulence genes transcriptional regulator
MSTINLNNNTSLNPVTIKKAYLVIRSINHKLRTNLLKLLDSTGEMTVTNLIDETGEEQSVISQQLAILRKQGIVKTKREGKWVWYSIDYDRLKEVVSLAEKLS